MGKALLGLPSLRIRRQLQAVKLLTKLKTLELHTTARSQQRGEVLKKLPLLAGLQGEIGWIEGEGLETVCLKGKEHGEKWWQTTSANLIQKKRGKSRGPGTAIWSQYSERDHYLGRRSTWQYCGT